MAVEEYCTQTGCWLKASHRGFHEERLEDMPSTCQCVFPNVGPLDECLRCQRVIAERVQARRAAR